MVYHFQNSTMIMSVKEIHKSILSIVYIYIYKIVFCSLHHFSRSFTLKIQPFCWPLPKKVHPKNGAKKKSQFDSMESMPPSMAEKPFRHSGFNSLPNVWGHSEGDLISSYWSGQIITTSHDLTPKGSLVEGKSPYFRFFQVGELLFHLPRLMIVQKSMT